MNFSMDALVRIGQKLHKFLTYLRRRFDNVYCHNQDLCMKYKRNVKHNGTTKYLGEHVHVCECLCVRMYVSLYM